MSLVAKRLLISQVIEPIHQIHPPYFTTSQPITAFCAPGPKLWRNTTSHTAMEAIGMLVHVPGGLHWKAEKSSKSWTSEKPSAPSSAYVINKFNWKQINLPTSFNIFQAHELLHPWNQGILSCCFFPLDHDPPDKQPKSTALVWVHLQKLQPNKTNTGTNHFYDLKKIMAHFIFFGIFNHFYTNFLMAHFISSFFLLGIDKFFVVSGT